MELSCDLPHQRWDVIPCQRNWRLSSVIVVLSQSVVAEAAQSGAVTAACTSTCPSSACYLTLCCHLGCFLLWYCYPIHRLPLQTWEHCQTVHHYMRYCHPLLNYYQRGVHDLTQYTSSCCM